MALRNPGWAGVDGERPKESCLCLSSGTRHRRLGLFGANWRHGAPPIRA